MSYESYANFRMAQASRMPFAELAQPMNAVGKAIYTAVEVAAQSIGQAFWAIKVKMRERAAINDLFALDERTLNDIGIQRGDIYYLAQMIAENPGVDHRVMGR